jgi:hypothetical protein
MHNTDSIVWILTNVSFYLRKKWLILEFTFSMRMTGFINNNHSLRPPRLFVFLTRRVAEMFRLVKMIALRMLIIPRQKNNSVLIDGSFFTQMIHNYSWTNPRHSRCLLWCWTLIFWKCFIWTHKTKLEWNIWGLLWLAHLLRKHKLILKAQFWTEQQTNYAYFSCRTLSIREIYIFH